MSILYHLSAIRVQFPSSVPFSGNTLFVGNLAWEVDEDTLGEFFTSQGHTPSSVRIITNQDGRSRGYVGLSPHTHVNPNSCTSNDGMLVGSLGMRVHIEYSFYLQVWLRGVYNA